MTVCHICVLSSYLFTLTILIGSSLRWFRLRGNLLFYLKGPEPWHEPVGVIILGQHQVKIQTQDENGYWPFQIGKDYYK